MPAPPRKRFSRQCYNSLRNTVLCESNFCVIALKRYFLVHLKDTFYCPSGFGTWKRTVMCFFPQKNLLFILSTVICGGYLFHRCLLYFPVQGKILLTLFNILSRATNILRSCTRYLRVLSDTMTFQDTVVLHLHHQENLFPHPLCARIHWTAAGAWGAQGEAETSSSSKTIKWS